MRSYLNLKDDRIGYKIRESSLKKIPYCIIVGEKETANGTINVRSRDKGDLGEMKFEDFMGQLESYSI